MSNEPEPLNTEAIVELLRALAHEVRLELLRALLSEERSVGEIEAVTGVNQPGLSQQLGVLRRAELVHTRREAKQIYYRLNHARFAQLAELIDGFAGTVGIPREQAERVRLASGGGAAMFARIG